MTSPINLISQLMRVIFMRGSPERVLYDRWLLRLGLLFAVLLAATAQSVLHQDHVVFVLLRVFAELVVFMLWMTYLTSRVGRLRLAQAMMFFFWISAFADLVLALLGLVGLDERWRDILAIGIGAIAAYGAANTLSWALRRKLSYAGAQVLGYMLLTWALDAAFRALYNLAAFG